MQSINQPWKVRSSAPARRTSAGQVGIDPTTASPALDIPRGHVGPFVIPGSGRTVWWTGRVAIGLRHQPAGAPGGVSQSALWLQRLMLDARPARAGEHTAPSWWRARALRASHG